MDIVKSRLLAEVSRWLSGENACKQDFGGGGGSVKRPIAFAAVAA